MSEIEFRTVTDAFLVNLILVPRLMGHILNRQLRVQLGHTRRQLKPNVLALTIFQILVVNVVGPETVLIWWWRLRRQIMIVVGFVPTDLVSRLEGPFRKSSLVRLRDLFAEEHW